MSDSLELTRKFVLDRHADGKRAPDSPSASTENDGEAESDELSGRAFGYLRGERERALHIVFKREREGDALVFPYSWLGPIRYHPSIGINMLFAGDGLYLVTVRGRNLNTLQDSGISFLERGIARHRVTWVRESSSNERLISPDECVVERIEVKAVSPEQVAQAFGLTGTEIRRPSP